MPKVKGPTRGIRNNNPGNIRKGDPWQGLAKPDNDGDFCIFIGPEWGLRALAINLISYQDKAGIRTIDGIVRRWAPPNENDTPAYVASVVASSGFGAKQRLDLHTAEHIKPIIKAIVMHENGSQPYTDAIIDKALVLAGVKPKGAVVTTKAAENASKAKVAVGAAGTATAAIGAASSAGIDPTQHIGTAVSLAQTAMMYAPWALGVAVAIGAVVGLVWYLKRKKAA